MSIKSNITGGETEGVFRARLLGKYDVDFHRCRDTGYIQTEKPYWLEEAYKSPMNLCDTGVLTRNMHFSAILRAFLGSWFAPGGRFLDYAGGYGVLTRMMRDAGLDYYWCDPYTQNVLARGFEHEPELHAYSALSAIEVFEHLTQPQAEVAKIFALAPNVVFSTVLIPDPWPRPADWWYYGLDHGQHVSFYTLPALEAIAHAHNKILVTNGRDFHGFLEPDLPPLEIEVGWLRRWLTREGRSHANAIRSAYEFLPSPQPNRRWTQKVKQLVRKNRAPGVWLLKGARGAAEHAALLATPLVTAYAGHLLSGGGVNVERLGRRFPSRTVADMEELARRMTSRARGRANLP